MILSSKRTKETRSSSSSFMVKRLKSSKVNEQVHSNSHLTKHAMISSSMDYLRSSKTKKRYYKLPISSMNPKILMNIKSNSNNYCLITSQYHDLMV